MHENCLGIVWQQTKRLPVKPWIDTKKIISKIFRDFQCMSMLEASKPQGLSHLANVSCSRMTDCLRKKPKKNIICTELRLFYAQTMSTCDDLYNPCLDLLYRGPSPQRAAETRREPRGRSPAVPKGAHTLRSACRALALQREAAGACLQMPPSGHSLPQPPPGTPAPPAGAQAAPGQACRSVLSHVFHSIEAAAQQR